MCEHVMLKFHNIYRYIYISFEILYQKALEVLSDVYPLLQDLITLDAGI